ncbi:lipid phosphate phosphatase epsilon 2, chloroplastic [Magnolia sinica]|uniref:lipid phosphate phosphatase epsilon 2, chloroplastic n=1 Tax=Magnolia sinica TaxID=86752 RepID=UPI0026588C1C|nr:lipid phosphate phosphatase epsilon 2, chloroplastic [Magnolia sinica]
MSAAISYVPTFRFSPCFPFRLKSPKPISFPEFPTSASVFVGGFLSRRSDFEKFKCLAQKEMNEMRRISSFGSHEDAENRGFMESDGSSELTRSLWSGGLESALNRSSKWLVAALFGSVIILKHDAEALWAAMGAVLNSSLSTTLKQILNQQRPASALRSDPGMPSSHAQSIFYIAVFAVVSLIEWLGINALTLTFAALILICGAYLSWLRVSQQLHTVSQVVVGATVGSICSILWFWSWHEFMLKAFNSFLWVRIVVLLGSAIFSVGFLLYVIRNWLVEEN